MNRGLSSLVRSGWWAAVACVIVSIAVVVVVLRSGSNGQGARLGDGRNVSSYGFDLSTSLVPADQIVASGMARDGLRALDHPATLTPAEILAANEKGRGKLLVGSDRVLGYAAGGEARAYPLRLLRWHEVVNDAVGGCEIVVTYSPLCDATAVFSRQVDGEPIRFAVSGLLLNSNLLMYDQREDGGSSLWSQIQARAVAGPAAVTGSTLEVLDGQLATWSWWQERHPQTTVMAPEADLKRLYKRDPYHSYFGSDLLHFPVQPLPPPSDLGLKDRVVAVTLNGERRVFALPRLAKASGSAGGRHRATVGGIAVDMDFAVEPGIATVTTTDPTAPSPALQSAFWFAWHAAFPEVRIDD